MSIIKELNKVFFGELMNEETKHKIINYAKEKFNIKIKCSFNYENRSIEVNYIEQDYYTCWF